MKIALTNYCNSKCPYCFAGNMGLDCIQYITKENFIKILDWMVKVDDRKLVLLGGEPTIHPEFESFIKIAKEYQRKYGWENILILSNSVEIGKFAHLLEDRVDFLINVNSPATLGSQEKYNKMIKSLKELNIKTKAFFYEKITLGCNIHMECDDYSFFWKIVDTFHCRSIRASVVSPCRSIYLSDRDTYFKKMKSKFIDFIKEASKRKIEILMDCSYIPPCYFSGEEMYMISKSLLEGALVRCAPMAQTLPDLTTSVCFGDSGFEKNKKKLTDFNSLKELADFTNNWRKLSKKNHFLKKCENCELRKTEDCLGGCFGFTDGEIEIEDE